MLNPEKCFAILAHVVDAMRSEAEFHLLDWDIHYGLGRLEEGTSGECERKLPYRTAKITMDPSNCDTYERFYECCVHEMFHVVLASFDSLYHHTRDHASMDVWVHALEPAVVKLERFYARTFRSFDTVFTEQGDPLPKPDTAGPVPSEA